jgi:hypothetical protein
METAMPKAIRAVTAAPVAVMETAMEMAMPQTVAVRAGMATAAAMAILETAVEATETATLEAGVVPEEAGAEALRPATMPV